MANTFKKIQTVTVGSGGAANITFSSIPQTYTDLKILVSGRMSSASGATTWWDFYVRLNNSTSNDSDRFLYGNGTAIFSSTDANDIVVRTNSSVSTASVFGSTEIYIPNYTSANSKTVSIDNISENNATSAFAGLTAGIWNDTAAVTSIVLVPTADNFAQYTTATLYGVANVPASNSPYATGGDQIYTDNTYWYHIFNSSGTFTPTKSLTCDYLVVAGGGAGGNSYGGGGGAGGLRSTVTATGGGGSLESALSLTATAYTVTVGAGGAGAATKGVNGNNSVFSTITSTGGGGGGTFSTGSNIEGSTGGSGGGGGSNLSNNANGPGGAGTANQGYAGGFGRCQIGTNASGGGGGGANAVGANASSISSAGAGGAGVATSITGTSVTRAGGGGGGTDGSAGAGGAGGGATGGAGGGAVGGNATTNTGSGGGGGSGGANGGSGGSGIVIVRYAV